MRLMFSRTCLVVPLLLGVVAGCLQAPIVTCDDGSVCATGTTCVRVESITLCATDENYTACAGALENQPCAVGATPGNCKGGVCFPQRCGDAYVDPAAGEVCDGNASSPTGYCTEDCRSTGVCGNEYIDRARGEHCDTGQYGLGRDGCSSQCLQEELRWADIAAAPPLPRAYAAMAFDRQRKRMVLFGGQNAQGVLDETWEFDGMDWHYMRVLDAPPARKNHVMAYDEVRQQIVMFGGQSSASTQFDDTWIWDGATWTNKTPAVHPSARYGAAMAFDAARGEVVLFGGVPGLSDTWLWNGSEWNEATNSTRPPGRGFGQLSNDRKRQRLVMIGGIAIPPFSNDTWEWDGADWLKRTSAHVPPLQIFQPMAYSDDAELTLYSTSNDRWTWDGTDWSRLPGTTTLPGSSMQYDSAKGAFLLFGGDYHTEDDRYDGKTYWVNESGTSNQIQSSSMPGRRAGHSLDYNVNVGALIMFGGVSGGVDLGDTWYYRNGLWHLLNPPVAPSPRRYHASAFDPVRNKLVVWGGIASNSQNANIRYDDVWEFDFGGDPFGKNARWTERTPSAGPRPTPSFSATMTFDTVRKRVLLSGGVDTNDAVVNEVWEWDGANGQWIDRTPPPAQNASRANGDKVVFDQRRGRAVLVSLSGTWEWDNNAGSWTLKATAAAGPPARVNAALAYDPVRAKVVVFGGSSNQIVRRDLWEWDGSAWQRHLLATTPPSLDETGMAYDAVNARFVLFGGSTGEREVNDIWALEYRSADSPAEICLSADLDTDGDGLAGCADPDCWGVCTPMCPPYVSCDKTAPRCGDGECNLSLETALLCPTDCH